MNLVILMVRTNTRMMELSGKTLIVLVGATGTGKTDLSINLAKRYNAPIISTDSRQIYKGMPIGTAQPSQEQLDQVEHYMIANQSIHDHYTCGQYEKDALATLDILFKESPFVIAVGGSGLYIDALCKGIDFMPETDFVLRKKLMDELESDGLEPLVARLKELDPAHYEVVEKANPQRVLRALEVTISSGKPYSSFLAVSKTKRPFKIIKIGVDMERKVMYERINTRVDLMLEDGLESEARTLLPNRELNSLQTVGYRELFDYFDGNCTFEEAVSLIKRNSRRYAKRQITWFKRDSQITWVDPIDLNNIFQSIDNQLNNQQ